jgi:hypothetical protein
MTLTKEQTTIETWFERDRAHVELRDARNEETIVEWWDDAVAEAVEDGFLDSRDWNGSAYQYAREQVLLPVIPQHWIAGSGEYGCLYDSCAVYHSKDDAVNGLAETFSLGRTRKAALKRDRTLALNPQRDGAGYCEISACDCATPWVHDDQLTEEDWNA